MISMPDSTVLGNLPMGYPAYLGYVDGEWPTAERLPVLFPGAKFITLTVTGASLKADGVDCEPGNVTAAEAAEWIHQKVYAAPGFLPVAYADLETPGYSMGEVIAALLALGITRSQYRILTAHYTGQAHVCGQECGVGFTADGTQWTSRFTGIGGSQIDMSLLDDSFFGAPAPSWTFGPVRGLTALPGHTSVLLSWSAPGQPAPGAVHHYQVTVRKDGQDVATYPRDVPKGSNPQSWQGGSLEPGSAYQALVRAMTADGSHAGEWATVTFTTGHD